MLVRPQACGPAARLLRGLPVSVYPDPAAAVALVERPACGGASAVLVHDAARPLAPPALAEAVAARCGAVHAGSRYPCWPLADTVKHVHPDGLVVGGPDRSGAAAVQTPQAFRPDLLCADALAPGPHGRARRARLGGRRRAGRDRARASARLRRALGVGPGAGRDAGAGAPA